MGMKKVIFAAILALTVFSCVNKVGLPPKEVAVTPDACDSIKYSVDIQPLLSARCAGCHSASPNFAVYADTKAKVDDGTFKNRVITLKDMPLGGPALSQSELDKIQCWLDKGAPNN